jgi:hypothetical protein
MQTFFVFPARLICTLSLALILWCGSALGLTKQITADYSNQNSNHISHYVVVQKNRTTHHQIRLEAPFFRACANGTCTMPLDLAPDTEYEFTVFFKNAAGDGSSRQITYKTGKEWLFEKNPPIINARHTMISPTRALVTGSVYDASHVDVRIPGSSESQNLGYAHFSFEVDIIPPQQTLFLEAEDVHGNIIVVHSQPDPHMYSARTQPYNGNTQQSAASASPWPIILLSPSDNAVLHHDRAEGTIAFMFTKIPGTARYVLNMSLYHVQTGTTLPLDIELIPGTDDPGFLPDTPLPTPNFFEKGRAMVYEQMLDPWTWQMLTRFDIHWGVEAYGADGELIGATMSGPFPEKYKNRLSFYYYHDPFDRR